MKELVCGEIGSEEFGPEMARCSSMTDNLTTEIPINGSSLCWGQPIQTSLMVQKFGIKKVIAKCCLITSCDRGAIQLDLKFCPRG